MEFQVVGGKLDRSVRVKAIEDEKGKVVVQPIDSDDRWLAAKEHLLAEAGDYFKCPKNKDKLHVTDLEPLVTDLEPFELFQILVNKGFATF